MLYYLHRALFKLGFFNRFNLQLSTSINHHKFRVPVINGFGYYHLLEQEKWFILLLQQLMPVAEGVFVDVGMNIGQTMLKFYSMQDGRDYFGFEPNPMSYYYCQKLAESNQFQKCQLFPVGLADKDDVVTLYMDMDIASGASILKDFRTNMDRYRKHINVPVFKGDEILGNIAGRFGIIKADVEGSELEVVKGCLHVIKRDLPFLILEILPVYNLNTQNGQYRKTRQDELLSILFNLRYCMFRIDSETASLHALNEIDVHGNMQLTNYLFVHETKKGLINA